MNDFLLKLQQYKNGAYDFLKLYNVCFDKSQNLCEIVFLYPEELSEIDQNTRDDILNFATDYLKLHCNIKVKFKKSFLDERLLKTIVLKFFQNNFKSISAQLNEKQIIINKNENLILIELHLCKEIINMFDNVFIEKLLLEELNNNFIGNFQITIIESDSYNIADKIPQVAISVKPKKVSRYNVEIIKKLFGKDISPYPEFIKDINKPKINVILSGKIFNLQKKSFVIKSGKRKGEEKFYFTFSLNDGNSIDCVYFSTKTNEKKCSALADGMYFLCLGNIKIGLSNKLTYYISSMSLAQKSNKVYEDENKNSDFLIERTPVVNIEDFYDHKQENIFIKEPVYKEIIALKNIVVYDLETTGLDPESCEIIEIGAIKIEKGKITKKFSTFVKPKSPIPQEASRINHITDEMVKDAPGIEDVILDFYDFSKDCVLSGYNNTDFDNKFLRKAGQQFNVKFNNENIDVLLLARSSNLKLSNYKLSSVASALNIDLSNAHRAYNDAFATAKILLKLNEID